MFSDKELQIIDRAYEASVVPDLWPQLCDLLSGHIDAYSTALIALPPGSVPRWVASERIAEQMLLYEQSGLAERTDRPARGLAKAPNAFMRDIDILSEEELATDLLRTELLEPLGLAWELGGSFIEPSGTFFVFSQLRQTQHGPFPMDALHRMNALKPHLARAAFLATRLGLKQARSMTESLELIGLAGAVIGDGGQVLAANQQFLALSPRIRIHAKDSLLFQEAPARAAYVSAIARVRAGKTAAVQSIPIPPSDDEPALVVQLIPVRRLARDIFNKSCGLVVVTPVGEVGPPDLRVICGLFDLTPAEAVVAQKITLGLSIDEIASSLVISKETVRTHVKALFRKTGVNRQAELVRLLAGLAPRVSPSEGV